MSRPRHSAVHPDPYPRLRHHGREIEAPHQRRALDRAREVAELERCDLDLPEVQQALRNQRGKLTRRLPLVHELPHHFPVIRQHLAHRQFERYLG